MTGRKFFVILGVLFLIALGVYILTTPRGNAYPLIGVVDGNDVIVSPQITDRMIKLNVDEGSVVKKGELIAELDPAALQAQVAAQDAAIGSLRAQVVQAQANLSLTDSQTAAALRVAQANYTGSQAQLEQAKATSDLNQINMKREVSLFESGVVAAQDRDSAVATFKASDANVRSLVDQVKSQEAALAVATANRKQVDVLRSQIASTEAQLKQAISMKAEDETQLGYTKIYAPIGGIVSVRVAKQGEVVQEGSPIVVLVDMDDLWVRADVPETYINSIQFGQKMPIKLPSGEIVDGKVFFKGVEGDFATQRDVSRTKRDIQTFAIKVSLPNPEHRFFTGMTATVLLSPQNEQKHWWARL
ncbi:MAG TPA: HlyD family efflux transporter periplasmic adaptor subunit [Candidatus Acidoferrales bacterium]|nr:HlyD family efflux transporter periplasmic adaptor subunit [Candidatus Acidoferrales bacterium]